MSENKRYKTEFEDQLDKFLRKNQGLYGTIYCPPLHKAAHLGRDEFVLHLVEEKKVEVNSTFFCGWTPLMVATREGRLSTVRLLLELGANVHLYDTGRMNALFLAVFRPNRAVIQLLIDHGAEMPPGIQLGNNWVTRKLIMFVRDRLVEKKLSVVVTAGIMFKGQFRDFLADGVCDARLLIHISAFACTSF